MSQCMDCKFVLSAKRNIKIEITKHRILYSNIFIFISADFNLETRRWDEPQSELILKKVLIKILKKLIKCFKGSVRY